MRCLHVDEAGHDDGVPVVQKGTAEHEAPVVPDGDGVDEPSFDLHCRHQLTIGIRKLQASTLNPICFHLQPQRPVAGSVEQRWRGCQTAWNGTAAARTYLRRGRRGRA